MKALPKYASRLVPAAFVLLFAWMIVSNLRPISNADFWWHLATGRYMAATRTVPKVDIFSFTCAGHRWINGYWLFELVLWGLFSVGGFTAVILAKSLFVALIFFIVQRRLSVLRIPWFWQLLFLAIVFIGASLSSLGWTERADLVTLFFMALLFLHLDRDYGTDRWKKTRWLWPFLFMVWANAHPGFLLGLAAAAFYVLPPPSRGRIGERVSWLCACFATTLLNPNGIKLYASLAEGIRNPAFISEWSQPGWPHFHIFWIVMALFWMMAAWSLYRLPVCLFFTWLSVRHALGVPLFMLCIAPYLLTWLSRSKIFADVERWMGRETIWVCRAALLFLSASLLYAVPQAGTGVDSSRLPVEACEFIAAQLPQGRFFNDYNFGSYWTWRFGSAIPDFIDGRYPTVAGSLQLNEQIVRARNGTPDQWNAFLDRYGVTAALVAYPAPSPIDSIFRIYFPASRWALVYWDDLSAIFVRRTPENGKAIAAHEYQDIYPDMNPQAFSRYLSAASPAVRSQIRESIERNAQLHPQSRKTQSFLAEALR